MSNTAQPDRARKRVVYHGHVQGVFFRATTAEIARDFQVAGYVRNQADGSVELEVEGAADEVERFLQAVARRYARNIARTDQTELPARQDTDEFEIRY